MKRHEMVNGRCWCGSAHDWTLSLHGWCECDKKDCDRVHRGGKS